MSQSLTIECSVHFQRQQKGRKELQRGPKSQPPRVPSGRVPRVARLLALAHRLEGLLRTGVLRDYGEIARLGHVTVARVSQVLSLVCLAPDIQEQILFLPRTIQGRDKVRLHELLPIARELDWRRQRKLWQARRLCPEADGLALATVLDGAEQ